MKPSAKILSLSLVLAALASSAFANTVTFGANNTNYRIGNGGEFNLLPNGGDPDGLVASYNAAAILAGGFETFCIQVGEHINFGQTFEYQISTSAQGPTGTDEISRGTAWLYSQFAQGTLSGYNYAPGAGRATSAGKLQNAIWFLEGEIDLTTAGGWLGNPFLYSITQFFTTNPFENAYGEFDVYALNLGSSTTSGWEAQDQLVYRGHGVPDGGAPLAMLGLALLGLAGFRRKFTGAN